MQLEQQVYSIEAANINYETLQAMKQAGSAMEQIHGGMDIVQVDETMYVDWTLPVFSLSFFVSSQLTIYVRAGPSSRNNTHWPTKSVKRLLLPHWEIRSTKTSWMPSWRDWSRRLWTSGCSILVPYRSTHSWTGYRLLELPIVSLSTLHVVDLPCQIYQDID